MTHFKSSLGERTLCCLAICLASRLGTTCLLLLFLLFFDRLRWPDIAIDKNITWELVAGKLADVDWGERDALLACMDNADSHFIAIINRSILDNISEFGYRIRDIQRLGAHCIQI